MSINNIMQRPLTRATPFYPGQYGVHGADAPLGLRDLPEAIVYYVNSEHPDSNDLHEGTNPEHPMTTILAAYNRCTAGQNDVVALVAQGTAYAPLATHVWAKSYTHLIGASADLYGVGQRCRIEASNVVDITPVFQITGSGCIFQNLKIINMHNAAEDSGAVEITGGRNHFVNCMLSGMGHATAGARAGSYSVLLNDCEENQFDRCSIGLTTIMRAADNTELLFEGTQCFRNRFVDCEFVSLSVTAGKVLVRFDAAARMWTTQFENCLFDNFNQTAGGALGALIDNVFEDLAGGAGRFHQILLRGHLLIAGCTGVSDTLTNIFGAQALPVNTYGLGINPAA